MRWQYILAILAILILLLANPAAARGNITPGIYPGTVKEVCVGDTIFVGETGLNLTPITPNANGIVEKLRIFENDDPDGVEIFTINVKESTNFDVPTAPYYGIYYPVVAKKVMGAYPIRIQPYIPGYPQSVVITSSREWMVANGIDSALLTITVLDGAGNPIPGADLALGAGPPWAGTPWQLRDPLLETADGGKAQTTFLPTTKSGDAIISASATVGGLTTAPVTTTLIQKIEADTPQLLSVLYPVTATVGSPQRISVRVTDRYGNPVTSMRAVNNVSFFAAASGTGVFLDGMGTRLRAISVPLNDTGWAEVTFLVGTKQGDNFISITPPAPLSSSLINIRGIGDSKPFSITQVVNPAGDPPQIPADGEAQATIDYYLQDQWGNPSADQGIRIVTSVGENRIFSTNQEGRATILYGPKWNASFYSLTATAIENSSVSISQTLQFVSMDPTNMLLTAIPQTMASLDVNKEMVASVIAKVIDERGNPVKGQAVNFSIEKTDNGTFVQTEVPSIRGDGAGTKDIGVPVTVITDENGQAILSYYPGAFPDSLKSANAQGTTIINATWVGKEDPVTRNISLNYKNYPFISVYTDVSPRTVMVGALVNVSVRLKGDGWALWPKPIDVVLCTDRSATMLYNESIGLSDRVVSESKNDRMVDAKNAALTFLGNTTGQDRIGLVTFGNPWGGIAFLNTTGNPVLDQYRSPFSWRTGKDYACDIKGKNCNQERTDDGAYVASNYLGHGLTGRDYRVNGVATNVYVESGLVDDKSQVAAAIKSIVPAGGTPMREALYRSVKLLNDNGREDAVRAVILLTDGKWEQTGDPRGIDLVSWGGPASYPGLPDGPGGDEKGSVITWAKENGVKIFTIALGSEPYRDQLQAYADETGGKFHEAANGTVLESIYRDIAGELREEASVDTQVTLDFSTMEVNTTYTLFGNETFDYLYLPARSTLIIPPEPPQMTVNNTEEWINRQPFRFSAGTIKVDQEWLVNFTLRARIEGNIRLLGGNSKVTFVGKEGEVSIPDTYVTAIPFGTEKGPEDIMCNVQLSKPEPDGQITQLEWDLKSYNGHEGNLTWEVWIVQPYLSFEESFDKEAAQNHLTYPLFIGDLDPGTYMIEVRGKAGDLSMPCSSANFLTIPEPEVTPQILIQ